jgi:DNA-directed RNA polymerase specialized sigma24 family protein
MPTDESGSVTAWIPHLKAGEEEAVRALWDRYFGRLVELARARLRAARSANPSSGGEDVALSAFTALWAGAKGGRFPELDDREDLWRMLVTITAAKVVDRIRHEARQKRGGGRVLRETELEGAGRQDDEPIGLDALPGNEPSPAVVALLAEEAERRLDALGDETLRRVALLKMEGYTAEQVAGQLHCAVRTVKNKLKLIRLKWEDKAPLDQGHGSPIDPAP